MNAKVVAATALCLTVAAPASAYEWIVEARVTIIEVTYMPSVVVFQIDRNAGGCPAGTWLNYFPRGTTEGEKSANAQAVLAGLMTARASDRTVRLHGSNANCAIEFVHML